MTMITANINSFKIVYNMSPLSTVNDVLTAVIKQDDHGCIDGCVIKWKAGFAAILLVEGLLFGLLVYMLKKTAKGKQKFNTAFHFGNALSAGVFLATGLLHILPETVALLNGEQVHGEHEEGADDGEEEHEEETHGSPWAFFVFMISFYLFFAIERIILPKIIGKSAAGCSSIEEEGLEVYSMDSHEAAMEHGEKIDESPEASSEEDVSKLGEGFRSEAFAIALIQIVGISAHSFFESMALGLSTDFFVVLHIFIATAAHRWATAMAISFRMVKQLRFLPFLCLLGLFSVMVPLGIGIGAALTNLSVRVQGVLFGISAGTFLYIGAFECMSEEFVVHRTWLLRKFLITIAGAGIISAITAILSATGVHG